MMCIKNNVHKSKEKNSFAALHRDRTNNSKFVWKHKRPWKAKAIMRKKEKNHRYHSSRFQTILQNHSNKNNLVLAQKQTHQPMEQNREPRMKSQHTKSINIQQRNQEYPMGKGESP